jgi:prepilin peptidase CpaA
MALALSKYVLLLIVTLATVLDIKTRKIPNWLTINGLLLGLLINIYLLGFKLGLFYGLGGVALALLVCIIPFALRVLGAGDVKLLMLIGAFLGYYAILWVLIFTALSGGLMAVIFLVVKGDIRSYWNHIFYKTVMPGKNGLKAKLPYSIAILCGLVLTLISQAIV